MNNKNKIATYLKEEINLFEEEIAKDIDSYYEYKKDFENEKKVTGLAYLIYKDTVKAEESDSFKKSMKRRLSLHKTISNLKTVIDSSLNHVVNLKNIQTWYEEEDDRSTD